MSEELKVYEEKMEKSIDALLNEYASIRAGRANPHVLDKIKVDYYGTPTPIQQVGNISVPEARMILIQPWEKSLIRPIEMTKEGLGGTPLTAAQVKATFKPGKSGVKSTWKSFAEMKALWDDQWARYGNGVLAQTGELTCRLSDLFDRHPLAGREG